jgi:hypothetical protein
MTPALATIANPIRDRKAPTVGVSNHRLAVLRDGRARK